MHKQDIYYSIVSPLSEAQRLNIPFETEEQKVGSQVCVSFYFYSEEDLEEFREKMSHWL